MGQQNFRLGREDQRVVEDAPVQRLLSKAVARDQESTPAAIPKSKGKHAVELADHSVAVLFVQMWQHFSVRSATKLVSALFEIDAQLAIVVNLAVEDDSDRAVFVENRLFTGHEIDDRQAAHSECYAGRRKQTF